MQKVITATSNVNEFCKDVTYRNSQCYGEAGFCIGAVKNYRQM